MSGYTKTPRLNSNYHDRKYSQSYNPKNNDQMQNNKTMNNSKYNNNKNTNYGQKYNTTSKSHYTNQNKFNEGRSLDNNKYFPKKNQSSHSLNKFNEDIDHSSDNSYLENYQMKEQIIEYLYSTVELSNYKYKLIEYEYDLPLLKEKLYYVSPNYNGIHSLLVFKKIKDKYFSFLIDRKTLTYNINQIDYEKVKIIPIYVHLDESIYNGTIIDGVLLYNNINGMKNFVINDIYYFRGADMTTDKITNKILHISTYLEKMNYNHEDSNIIFIINKLYPLNEIQQLVNIYIPKSKYNKSIKGLSFYSEFSGTKLIYLYNNCSHEKVESSPEMEIKSNSPEKKTIKVTSPKALIPSDTQILTFKMKKTDIIDVYNLFLGEKVIENKKKILKYKKIGIASIPTKECSFFCKEIFNQISEDNVLMDCKYDESKNKWIPINLATNKKRADLIDKLES